MQDHSRPARRTTGVEDAAAMLGIGRRTAYALIRQGTFPTPVIHAGRRVVIPRAAIERLLTEGIPVAPSPPATAPNGIPPGDGPVGPTDERGER